MHLHCFTELISDFWFDACSSEEGARCLFILNGIAADENISIIRDVCCGEQSLQILSASARYVTSYKVLRYVEVVLGRGKIKS